MEAEHDAPGEPVRRQGLGWRFVSRWHHRSEQFRFAPRRRPSDGRHSDAPRRHSSGCTDLRKPKPTVTTLWRSVLRSETERINTDRIYIVIDQRPPTTVKVCHLSSFYCASRVHLFAKWVSPMRQRAGHVTNQDSGRLLSVFEDTRSFLDRHVFVFSFVLVFWFSFCAY